ncbi:class I SAM-dependent methyltransferase [soil metagenome]
MKTKLSNANIDTWNGELYNKNSSLQYDYAMAFLHKQKLRGDEQILDVGCGDGKISREIATLVSQGNVLGIDASVSMLQVAELANNPVNLTFQPKDAQQLNFDCQFDLVTSFFCLQWVPNKLAAFQGIYQSLKPGGCLLAIMPMVSSFSEAPNKLMSDPHWQKYFVNYPDPLITARDTQYDNYIIQANLQLFNYHIEPITVVYPTLEEASSWLRAVTPHLTRLSNEQEKDAFIRAAVELYLQEVPLKQDGSCCVNHTLIKVIAHRPMDLGL